MCNSKTLSKQHAIYQAVLSLLSQGREMHTITVQQIAETAKIGKGTVYEYFSSREEIFEGVLQYQLEQELSQIRAIISQTQVDFIEKLDQFFQHVEHAVQSKTSSLQLVFSNLQHKTAHQDASVRDTLYLKRRAIEDELFTALLADGVAQGYCSQSAVAQYGVLCVNGAMMAFASTLIAKTDAQEVFQLRQTVIAMLMKSLSDNATKKSF